jgi:CRISPR/Cas system-associated exonuclease Cas4 (RecB family)
MSSADYKRLESPTSILTYMQCPRKYYYHYIKKLGVKSGIHLALGRVVHSSIEAFHKVEFGGLGEDVAFGLVYAGMTRHFTSEWKKSTELFDTLGLKPWERTFYFSQGLVMLDNFYRHYMSIVRDFQGRRGLSFSEAFERVRPKTEVQILSKRLGVMGVVDAVHNYDRKISIIDYKTSNKNEMDAECMIQLSILALLYNERFGKTPDRVGIHFLRHGLRMLPVIPDVLEFGEKVCSRFRWVTDSDDICDYPQKKSGLCKYRTGQCDYYKNCMETSEWV